MQVKHNSNTSNIKNYLIPRLYKHIMCFYKIHDRMYYIKDKK